MARLLLLLAATLVIAGCGGPDEADVEEAIRGWAKAANERDAEALCNDYVTQDFAEGVSGATGDNARKQCEKLFDVTQPGLKVEILDVSRIEIDGDSATAIVRRQATGSEVVNQRFELEKEDGEFRIARSGGRAEADP